MRMETDAETESLDFREMLVRGCIASHVEDLVCSHRHDASLILHNLISKRQRLRNILITPTQNHINSRIQF